MLKNSLNKFAKSVLLSSFLLGSHLLASEVTQIRNATVKINYGGKVFLVDPMFAVKDAYKGFEGTLNSHLNWPRVELPFSTDEILKDVDAVIITHTHEDHLDEVAIKELPKNILIFVQDEKDKNYLEKFGFTNIKIMKEDTFLGNVKLSITAGQHGSDEVMSYAKDVLGEVSGVIFQAKNEKTIYLAGDTVYNKYVEDVVERYSPDIIILNAGDAKLENGDSIIMGKEDVLKTHKIAPKSIIIASHMEAVNHASLTRGELKSFVKENGIEDFVLIPKDGESLEF
ncbi:MBL fold metallo-hydrolase [Aliarcobacter vitoriensis]|uniref:MBL fold metallo-hydrolase n=1 Tax=Aliarcobacter vitoriensis TaxID=2011099 RepID=UPI003AB04752